MRNPFFLSFRFLVESEKTYLVQKVWGRVFGFSSLWSTWDGLLFKPVFIHSKVDCCTHSRHATVTSWTTGTVEIPDIHLPNPLLVLVFPGTVGVGVGSGPLNSQTTNLFAGIFALSWLGRAVLAHSPLLNSYFNHTLSWTMLLLALSILLFIYICFCNEPTAESKTWLLLHHISH